MLVPMAVLISVAEAAGKAKHVVIVVMDGLRPDSITAVEMPNLAALAGSGTFFANHHSTYISTTEGNAAALATGMQPRRGGIIGNREYRPEIDPLLPVDTQGAWNVWKGDQLSGGKWVAAETLPEIVRRRGGKTAVAGTKEVALLWDRHIEGRTADGVDVFGGEVIPGELRDQIVAKLGPLPPAKDGRYFSNNDQDLWTTQVLIEKLWVRGLPTLSVLWLSEPDYAQHSSGPGSPVARLALRNSDKCLGRMLAALDATGQRGDTDVFVVSDHGFSTIAQGVAVQSDLAQQGLNVGGGFLDEPQRGSILMVGLGGSMLFYVIDHDRAIATKLVNYLQTTSYAGVIFSRDGLEGTFPLSQAGIDVPSAPDVILSMRWGAGTLPRAGAMPGLLIIDASNSAVGLGMHGSLSRFDMHNTLVAAGPDFKVGFKSATPSGNSDLAPTILDILGMAPDEAMDGRVLSEAYVAAGQEAPQVETQTIHASRASWQQYLKISKVGPQAYLDEGNAGDGK